WMLGGMSGGGMGFIFDPPHKAQGQARLQEIMSPAKRELQHALPFAMEPVVYDFAINERGTWAELLTGDAVHFPANYRTLTNRSREIDSSASGQAETAGENSLMARLQRFGFDLTQHEQIRADLKAGRIGLAQNRLSTDTQIQDVTNDDVFDA